MIKTYKSRNPKRTKERWKGQGKSEIYVLYIATLAVRQSGLHKFDMIGFSLWFMNSRLGTSKGLTKRTKPGRTQTRRERGTKGKYFGPKLTAHKLQQQQQRQLQ